MIKDFTWLYNLAAMFLNLFMSFYCFSELKVSFQLYSVRWESDNCSYCLLLGSALFKNYLNYFNILLFHVELQLFKKLLIKKYRFAHNKCTNWFGASIYFHAHARQNAKSINIYALYKRYHWYVILFWNGNVI